MIEKQVKKINILIIVRLALIAIDGANIALGIDRARWFFVASGLLCSIVFSWGIVQDIRTLERYAAMKVKEEQILHGLDQSNT